MAAGNKLPILLVDDVMVNIKMLRQILQVAGFTTVDCGTGGEALTLAKKFLPELILLDIQLPDMDGYEVCRRLKEVPETKDIPVLFLTGSTGSDAVVKGFNAGAVDYITKPFNGEELLARVRTHLELRRGRERLKELLATKDKLFSIISHDLRGPIGAISSILQSDYFMPGSMGDASNKRMFEMLKNTAEKSFQLLENLLDWSRSQRGHWTAHPTLFNLDPLIKGTMEIFEYKLEEKNLTVGYDLGKDSIVFCDKKMLQTILRNLVSNSIKFTPRGGAISFRFRRFGDQGILTVEDTGKGMKPEIMNAVLKPAGYITTKGTEGEGGSGLGLILCKELLEKCEGTLSLESEEGKGTSIHMTLPVEPVIA